MGDHFQELEDHFERFMNALWTIYERLMNDLWTIYERFMSDLWTIYERSGEVMGK